MQLGISTALTRIGKVSAASNAEDFVFTVQTTGPSETFTVPTNDAWSYDLVVDWGDGNEDTITTWDDAAWTHTYATADTYTIRFKPNTQSVPIATIRFNNGGDKDKIRTILQWGAMPWEDMQRAWYGCSNIAVADDAGYPDLTTNGCTSLFRTFRDTPVNFDMSDWPVSTIETIDSCFTAATNFNGALPTDWPALENADNLFNGATSFNHPSIMNMNAPNIRKLENFVKNAKNFDQPLLFDYSNVTTMAGALDNCGMSPINYDRTVDAIANSTTPPTGLTLDANFTTNANHAIQYTSGGFGATARTSLTDSTVSGGYGWTINDDGAATPDLTLASVSNVASTVDLVLFFGQSNIDGRATSASVSAPADTVAAAWTEHGLSVAGDPAGYDYNNDFAFTVAQDYSMLPKFATDYAADVGNYPVIVKVCKGGTGFTNESAVSNNDINHWGDGSEIFPLAMNWYDQAKSYLEENSKTVNDAGAVIMIGERDADYRDTNADYTVADIEAGIRNVIDKLIKKFGSSYPIYFINIGDECDTGTNTVTSGVGWGIVRTAISDVAGEYSNVTVADSAVGYCVSGDHEDDVHLDISALEEIAATVVDEMAAA